MIYIFVSLISGAVGACLAVFFMANRFPRESAKQETSDEQGRLNEEQTEREQLLKEQERQHENMMNYIGKEQKR